MSSNEYLKLFGHVITLSTRPTPSFLEYHARPLAAQDTPSPGMMLAVELGPDGDQFAYAMARVSNAWEANPYEDAHSATLEEVMPFKLVSPTEGESPVIYRVCHVEPLEMVIVRPDTGELIDVRSVTRLPRAGAPVYLPWGDLTARTLGLVDDESKAINLGMIRGSDEVRALVRRESIQRHFSILGAIGSGKSYTRGVIAEELKRLRVPQVNIDVNGEMIDAATELGGRTVVPGKDFHVPLSAFTAGDILNAVPSLGGNMVELVRHAHEELLNEVRARGDTFGVDELINKMNDEAPRLDMKPITLRPAVARVGSLRRMSILGSPFDWRRELTPGAFINIDCRGRSLTELRLIAASVARDVQRLGQSRAVPFVALSVDEAHLVAPSDDETVAKQVFRELARIGRHIRVGLILTTQSPRDIDSSILERTLTRFIHTLEPHQLHGIRSLFADASEDLIAQMPKMPVGVCVVTGAIENIRHAAVVRVRSRTTTHGGATPDVWKDLDANG
jgi:DNA helicase HerA-like ATPase